MQRCAQEAEPAGEGAETAGRNPLSGIELPTEFVLLHLEADSNSQRVTVSHAVHDPGSLLRSALSCEPAIFEARWMASVQPTLRYDEGAAQAQDRGAALLINTTIQTMP